MGCGSITPVTSVAESQQVTSSMWQLHRLFSPTLPPAPDTLSAEQVAGIYQLATECQALGTELAKQFQNLSGFEAMHCGSGHGPQDNQSRVHGPQCCPHSHSQSAGQGPQEIPMPVTQRLTKPGRIHLMSSSSIS